jgi:glycosyltransferase involved in cell wall biosynthesis
VSELRAACYRRDDWPTVSVVVPIRDEADHLERAVASILEQEYPLPFDVCLAVAPSDDRTEAIAAAIAEREPRVSTVPNPAGITPAGLNAAIRATSGEVVVRVDGHAELSPGYIRTAVETLRRTGAVNVGGMQVPKPETPFEEAVAAATTSWLGTGGATYRVGGDAGPVDTVYLGVFDREAGDGVGWFDEALIRNQDYELNIRLRRAGGLVWFEPALAVSYRPRGTLSALRTQYYEYGSWKADVVRRHPDSLRLRQLVPPIAILFVVVGLVVGVRWRPARLAPVAYTSALLGASLKGRARTHHTAAALLAMHTSWSFGFVGQLLRPSRIEST